jgi:hypothetical protein
VIRPVLAFIYIVTNFKTVVLYKGLLQIAAENGISYDESIHETNQFEIYGLCFFLFFRN